MKKFLTSLFFLPLLSILPYMFMAWKGSPMDRWDWIFVLLSLITAIIATKRNNPSREHRSNKNTLCFLPLIGGVIIIIIALSFRIHALFFLGSLFIGYGGVWLFWQLSTAKLFVPSFLICALGCTSSTYWLSFFTGISPLGTLGVKIFIALILLIISFTKINLPLEKISYGAFIILVLMIWGGNNFISKKGVPLLPEFFQSANAFGYSRWEVAPSLAALNFFKTSKIIMGLVADDLRTFHVLKIQCGKNLHEIHPASHCLRSHGAQILSEKQQIYYIDQNQYLISEIIMFDRHGKKMVFSWYSTSDFSVGNYLAFRRYWSKNSKWYSYQISTAYDHDEAIIRDQFTKLLSHFISVE